MTDSEESRRRKEFNSINETMNYFELISLTKMILNKSV